MNNRFFLLLGLFVLALTGCSRSPDPVEVSDVVEVEATVIAVDAQARTLELRGPDGNELGFNVGPEVRNLPQVEVGDILRVSYYTGYVVSMAEPGEAGVDLEIAAGQAEEGARPGAMIGDAMRATIEVLSVSSDGTAVSFRDPDGKMQSIEVQREDLQAFARKLKPGDLVDLQYAEALAIGIESAE